MKPALFAIALMLVGACAFGERSLPTARAVLHGSTVDLKPAAWCWDFGNRGECADSAGPELLLQSGYLQPVDTAGGFDATIEFQGPSALQHFEVDSSTVPTRHRR